MKYVQLRANQFGEGWGTRAGWQPLVELFEDRQFAAARPVLLLLARFPARRFDPHRSERRLSSAWFCLVPRQSV
jgi:hypothetical protein